MHSLENPDSARKSRAAVAAIVSRHELLAGRLSRVQPTHNGRSYNSGS
jgi:hypothetical protein